MHLVYLLAVAAPLLLLAVSLMVDRGRRTATVAAGQPRPDHRQITMRHAGVPVREPAGRLR